MKRFWLIGAVCALLLVTVPTLAVTTYGFDGQTIWIEHPDMLDPTRSDRLVATNDNAAWLFDATLPKVEVTGRNHLGDIYANQIIWIGQPSTSSTRPTVVSVADPRDFGINFPSPPQQSLSDCKTKCDSIQSAANDLCDDQAARDGRFVTDVAELGFIFTSAGLLTFGKVPGAIASLPSGFAVYSGIKKVGGDIVADSLALCRGVASKAHHDCLVDVCHVPG